MIVSPHRMRRAMIITAAPVIAILASPALAQDRGGGFLDNLFSRGESHDQAAQNQESDMVVQINQLREKVRQLTGTIEQLQYRNQQLERQLQQAGVNPPASSGISPSLNRNTNPNMNSATAAPARIQSPVASAMPPSQAGAAATPPPSGDAFDPSRHPNAPGVPRALGGGPAPIMTEEAPVGAPGGRAPGAPLDLSTLSGNAAQPPATAANGSLPAPPAPNTSSTGTRLATLPPSESPKDEYDLAYGYVLRKDYALAEQAFRDFIKRYPDDKMTADANYWLGETLFQRQRYQDAAETFLVVVRNYEKSGKAPDALLRLGQSLAAVGQKEMACASLGEVERKYPRASGSVKRTVTQEQKRIHC
jgi:tol-pal system protein YbgF